MAALDPGPQAPPFVLPGLEGEAFTHPAAPPVRRLLLAFFKVTCPTSQFTFPFIERLYRALRAPGLWDVWGISQDEVAETRAFAQEQGITFPLLLDQEPYPVSSLYQLTHVPTLFLIDGTGAIRRTSVGFFRDDLRQLTRDLAGDLGRPEPEIFPAGENVPPHQFG